VITDSAKQESRMASQPISGKSETVSLVLTFLIKCINSEWSALCLELDIASCGATEQETIESLKDLIDLYVADCVEARDIPVPMRPVPHEALLKFLSPPAEREASPFISRRETFPVHAYV
jgi:predicted RNase H-like HicB family nuclease